MLCLKSFNVVRVLFLSAKDSGKNQKESYSWGLRKIHIFKNRFGKVLCHTYKHIFMPNMYNSHQIS